MPIQPSEFFEELKNQDITHFTGVPDSLLKTFLAYLDDNLEQNHIIAANEGNAIAYAAGHYTATNKLSMVYLQNSGLGNIINPLLSMCKPYGFPMLLLIGWRGQPGVKDEPQHLFQGQVTTDSLDAIQVPYSILPDNIDQAKETLTKAVKTAKEQKTPYALVVKKGTFGKYTAQNTANHDYPLTRAEAIKALATHFGEDDIVVSTTGKPSRELYYLREELGQTHEKDFLNVGAMGHVSSFGAQIALDKPNRKVICLDGDGAAIMHMGALTTIGQLKLKNFHHIVLNNGAHDSVGGQPTAALHAELTKVAQACGYSTFQAESQEDIEKTMPSFLEAQGPVMLEVMVKKGADPNLGRPKETPKENLALFQQFVQR